MNDAQRPEQILIVRHAEKPPLVGKPYGIDIDGDPHPHSLIVRGWQRAGALVSFFCDPRSPLVKRPTSVYSPPSHGTDGDHGRPYETIVAVASGLNVEPQTRFTLDEEDALAKHVLGAGGVVLIGWEHKRIPRIVNALLGETTTAPQAWPDDRFDMVWMLDLHGASGTYRFSQTPQLLLAGDRPDPIV